jgi:hypothetical protein
MGALERQPTPRGMSVRGTANPENEQGRSVMQGPTAPTRRCALPPDVGARVRLRWCIGQGRAVRLVSGQARPRVKRRVRLHRQDNAELSFATEHARVGLIHFVERIFFDHRADAGELGEAEGIFGIGGDAGGPALEALAAED